MKNKQNNQHWKEALERLNESYEYIKLRKKGSGQYEKSEEHKIKLSKANKGNKPWNAGIKGKEYLLHLKEGKVWNKGMEGLKIHSKEHKEKLKKSMTGNKYREGLTPWNKGKTYTSVPCPQEKKEKISNSLKGHPCYKDKTRFKKQSKSLKEWYSEHPEAIKSFTERRKYLKLPKKDSTIEVKIQNYLKQLGIEFFTHQYMKEIEHGYQCDILIPYMNLVIECDGDYWHKYPVGLERDHIRTKELIEKGFKVLRLWERDIRKMDVNQFKDRLEETI